MKMKFQIELALVALLVVLLYVRSPFLNQLTSHPLAKLVLLGGVAMIAQRYGRTAGILSGLIAVLLFHNMFEGMESKKEDGKEGDEEKKGDEEEEKEEGGESDEEDEDEEHQKEIEEKKIKEAMQNTELIIIDEEMRPVDSNKEEGKKIVHEKKEKDAPVAAGDPAPKKGGQEAFSLLY